MLITKVTLIAIMSLIYMIGLAIVYFGKQRPNSLEIKYYSAMIITNIIGLVIHIVVEYSVVYFPPLLNSIILKSILYYYIIFADLFLCYLLVALKIKNSDKYIKIEHMLTIIYIILATILPEKLHRDFANMEFYTYGPDTKIAYLMSIISITIISTLYFMKRKEIKKKDKISIFSFILGMSLAGLVQNLIPELTITIYVESIVCCMMYFTIENPDVEVGVYNAAKTQAIKAGRAKEDFLSSMSHELRTPLNAIIGLSSYIKQTDDVAEIHSDANDIVIASQDLLQLIDTILTANKIENNNLELVEEEYSIKNSILELEKISNVRLEDKDVTLITNISEDVPDTLYGDKDKIRSIITNLLSNAIKYTNQGTINFNISCINKNDICKLEIVVKDTGRGMSKEQLDNIYAKFNRREEDKDSDIKGVGLGLAFTKSLVDLMEGTINVESEENVGTTFTVRLN